MFPDMAQLCSLPFLLGDFPQEVLACGKDL